MTSAVAVALALAVAPVTAGEALEAARAATSIGPDPCRRTPGDEIVVCGRVTNPYAVGLYGDAEPAAPDAPGTAAGNIALMRDAGAACRSRGEACLKPLPVVSVGFGAGKSSGVRIGKD